MPAFQFALDKRLRIAEFEGDLASAMVHQGSLQLQDNSNHVVRLLPIQIARMRIGYVDAKHRVYRTRIWLDGLEKPLEFVPTTATWAGYRETLTGLVQLMSESGRLARVETGSSKFDALLGPILTAIPTLGAYIIAGLVLTNEPWYGRMIVPAIPTVVLGALVWIGKKRYWPRPLRDIAALKVYLP